jgi:RNA polymerase sigma factor (sigma-70 family)
VVTGRAWSADDEAAYGAFYVDCFAGVARTALLVLRDRAAAEDVTQEAFVQLYVHWRKVSSYDSPQAWVRRVAIRLASRTAQRDRMRQMLHLRAGPAETAFDPHANPDLEQAIARLSSSQRAVVALFYFEDLPVAEIARTLEMSHSSVKVTLHRARKALADILGREAALDG